LNALNGKIFFLIKEGPGINKDESDRYQVN
jgi:hypothetical protein